MKHLVSGIVGGVALIAGLSGVALAQAGANKTPVPLYVGTQAKVNAGVVTDSTKYLNGTTKPIGSIVAKLPPSAKPGVFVALYVGTQAKVNAGVVTTNPRHMNGATRLIGYARVKGGAGGTPLYLGTAARCNAGVVTTNPTHLNCATTPIGFTQP